MTGVELSVGFYRHLEFAVQSAFEYRDRKSWAALESDRAEAALSAVVAPGLSHGPVPEVCNAGIFDGPDLLKLNLGVPKVVEQASTSPSSTGTT